MCLLANRLALGSSHEAVQHTVANGHLGRALILVAVV